ncbi:hypothetical protein [Aerosakkonema funiforme]
MISSFTIRFTSQIQRLLTEKEVDRKSAAMSAFISIGCRDVS